jgi:hypothetical protein
MDVFPNIVTVMENTKKAMGSFSIKIADHVINTCKTRPLEGGIHKGSFGHP